jgi:hypothetical protein
MFGYRARIGYISPSVMELNGYDFYRIVPEGVGLIAVTCMVEAGKMTPIEERWRRWKLARVSWVVAHAISSFTVEHLWC